MWQVKESVPVKFDVRSIKSPFLLDALSIRPNSEDEENENFWATGHEWCDGTYHRIAGDTRPSVCPSCMNDALYVGKMGIELRKFEEEDEPGVSSWEYDRQWNDDNQRNNWNAGVAPPVSSGWQEPVKRNLSGLRDDKINARESSGIDNFWINGETRDDNEYNNNEDTFHMIDGESVNQLDTHKNKEKIFYEKPKLDSQTVTYLYDSVLPPTEKCINYVNSIKLSQQTLENVTTPDEPELLPLEDTKTPEEPDFLQLEYGLTAPEEPELPESLENVRAPITVEREEKLSNSKKGLNENFGKSEVLEDRRSSTWPTELELVEVDVEVVELTTSVKETLQFPEIEDIPDSIKSNETNDYCQQQQQQQQQQREDVVIDHIDLIREAKELPCVETSRAEKDSSSSSSGGASSTDEESTKTRRVQETAETITSLGDSESSSFFEGYFEEAPTYAKLEEIDLLSSIGRDIGVDLEKYVQPVVPDVVAMESVSQVQGSHHARSGISKGATCQEDTNKIADQEQLPDLSSADTRKKEKMARNQARRRQQSHSVSTQNRRPDKRRADHIAGDGAPGGCFDVYNIETAMPKIDLDAIESHLRAAREEERRRRNDREEIRRRLAMGPDAEDLRAERGRKPSLQSRLQSGMNLQICFMNETPSDTESPGSENDSSPGSGGLSSMSKLQQQQHHSHQLASRPQVLSLPPLRVETGSTAGPLDEADFFARQARLQTEARMALAQAKEMAHMQMEVERQRLKQSPITEMVRSSLEKVGVQLGEDRRRLSRVLLTELNVAQLQVVANDLHARIAMLNEALVEGLLRRDDLHMEQDSMLVDVEDLTRYLGAKQESLKKRPNIREQRQQQQQQQQQRATGGGSLASSKQRGGHQHTPAKTSISREKLMNPLANHRAA